MNRTFMRVEEIVRKHGTLLKAVASAHAPAKPVRAIKRRLPASCARFENFGKVAVICVLGRKHQGLCSWEPGAHLRSV